MRGSLLGYDSDTRCGEGELRDQVRAFAGFDLTGYVIWRGGKGFDVKVIRQILSIRKKEPAEVEEQQSLLDLYMRALGM